MTTIVAHRPFSVTVAHAPMVRPTDYVLAYDAQTVEAIVADAIARGAAPERFWWHGRVTLDGLPIEPRHWHAVKPKPGLHVHLWIPPQDPLSIGLGSLLFSLGAPVALTNAAIGLASAILPTAIGFIGQLAINALFTPNAATRDEPGDIAEANSAGISQNIPRQDQPYPFVFGTARVAPQPLCHPRTYLSGDDEYAETVLALAGPHSMSDIRIDGIPVEGRDDIETWIDDGTAELRSNQFDTAAGPTTVVNKELAAHDARVNEDGETHLALRDQATPLNSLPGWEGFKSRLNADHLDIRLTIRNPYDASAGNVEQAIWLRLRARKVGESTWKNIGTLPYIGKGQGDFRRRIRFYFRRYTTVSESPKSPNGFSVPAATLPAVTNNHAVIKISDGERFPPAYDFRYRRQVEGIDIYPDDDDSEAYFTAGVEYEFDIQRSEMVEVSNLTGGGGDVATMYDGSDYWDFFDARNIGGGIWGVFENPEDQGDQVYLESAISMFEMDIVPPAATVSTLSVRVRNKRLSAITVLASSLVPNWNGSIWTGQAASSSPADHERHILTGERTVSPISTAHCDDETFGDWADECAAQSHAVNMAYSGGTIGEALRLVASCGYARPLEGLKYSVAYYHDTSAERPVQMFTPRNSRNASWSASFAPRPGAILARFLNADKNFEPDQIEIEDPYAVPGAAGDIEEVDFPGLTTEAEVTARALFDFGQLRRGTRYRREVGFEWLSSETRPGKVAMISGDDLSSQVAYGRVASVTDGSNFVVDADIDYAAAGSIFDLADIFSSANLFAEGAQWGVAVRSAATGEVVVLAMDSYTEATRSVGVSDTTSIAAGDLVTFGPLEQVTRRVLIVEVTPQGGDVAEVVCQDEGNDPADYFGFLLDEDGAVLTDENGHRLRDSVVW